MFSQRTSFILALGVALTACGGNGSASAAPPPVPTAASAMPAAIAQTQPAANIVDDYVYGLTPAIVKATRDIATAVPDNLTQGQAPINQFAYTDTLVTPQNQVIVRSNVDTLYTPAWLDLQDQPMILHVPDTAGRYYLIPMLDAYTNEFSSVGSRTTGDNAGNYAIVGPDWQGQLPEDVTGVIHAPTNTVWLIGRTLVRGQSDVSAADAIGRQFLLIPLSEYPRYLQTGSYAPPTGVPVVPPNPLFSGPSLLQSPGFASPLFFDYLLPYTQLNPAPADQEPQATELVANGVINESQVTSTVLADAVTASIAEARKLATTENGWELLPEIGSCGSNYLLRDATAVFGLGANLPADALYLSATDDNSGSALSGEHSYMIHFPPGQTPPAHGFWSITAYNQQGLLVANTAGKYSVSSETGLVPNADGSVDVFLQAAQPSSGVSNWLPVPSAAFNLTLRIYWPDDSALQGTWLPPAITVANAPQP